MLVERQQDLHSSQKQRQKASVMEITAGRRERLEFVSGLMNFSRFAAGVKVMPVELCSAREHHFMCVCVCVFMLPDALVTDENLAFRLLILRP